MSITLFFFFQNFFGVRCELCQGNVKRHFLISNVSAGKTLLHCNKLPLIYGLGASVTEMAILQKVNFCASLANMWVVVYQLSNNFKGP